MYFGKWNAKLRRNQYVTDFTCLGKQDKTEGTNGGMWG